jgi:hypothetical protein
MRQTRNQKRTRRPRHSDEALPLDPRDPDVLRAKRLPLLEYERPNPIKRAV